MGPNGVKHKGNGLEAVPDAIPSNGSLMPIAVVGMSCRLPGQAQNPEKLWDMLSKGQSGWSTIPKERFNADAFYHHDPEMHGAVRFIQTSPKIVKLHLIAV